MDKEKVKFFGIFFFRFLAIAATLFLAAMLLVYCITGASILLMSSVLIGASVGAVAGALFYALYFRFRCAKSDIFDNVYVNKEINNKSKRNVLVQYFSSFFIACSTLIVKSLIDTEIISLNPVTTLVWSIAFSILLAGSAVLLLLNRDISTVGLQCYNTHFFDLENKEFEDFYISKSCLMYAQNGDKFDKNYYLVQKVLGTALLIAGTGLMITSNCLEYFGIGATAQYLFYAGVGAIGLVVGCCALSLIEGLCGSLLKDEWKEKHISEVIPIYNVSEANLFAYDDTNKYKAMK